MSDPFLAIESSVDSSDPREGIEISYGATTYRITGGDLDLVIGGNVYTAVQALRSEQAISAAGGPQAVSVSLPVSHPVCQRYLAGGVPPRQILVTIRRQQGMLVEQVWCGYVTSMALDGHVASLLVPARSGETMKRMLPTITVARTCGYILYDARCRVDRDLFKVDTTATLIDGRTITLASVGGNPDDWATWGELLHVASGERMTVASQVGAVVIMQSPIFELHAGDAVTLYAGCSHDIQSGCRDKFNNVVNFGGFRDLPDGGNIFSVPSGYGVIQS